MQFYIFISSFLFHIIYLENIVGWYAHALLHTCGFIKSLYPTRWKRWRRRMLWCFNRLYPLTLPSIFIVIIWRTTSRVFCLYLQEFIEVNCSIEESHNMKSREDYNFTTWKLINYGPHLVKNVSALYQKSHSLDMTLFHHKTGNWNN